MKSQKILKWGWKIPVNVKKTLVNMDTYKLVQVNIATYSATRYWSLYIS